MIHAPPPGSGDTRFKVDLDRLHDIEPQDGLRMLPPSALSRAVVGRALRCVPYPLLGENTLCVSDSLVLGTDKDGAPALLVRVGDTYPNQHLEVVIKAYVYKWRHPARGTTTTDGLEAGGQGQGPPNTGAAPPRPSPAAAAFPGPTCSEPDDYEVHDLGMGYDTGADRLSLWLPVIAKHVITPGSPIASWLQPGGLLKDADACVAVTVEAYRYATATNAMRTRIFSVLRDVKAGSAFLPIVTSPGDSADHKPRVNWARFHDTVPLPTAAVTLGGLPGGGAAAQRWGPAGGGPRPAAQPSPPRPALVPSSPAPGPARGPGGGGGGASGPRLRRDSMDALRADAAILPSQRAARRAGGRGEWNLTEGVAATTTSTAVAGPLVPSSPPRLGRLSATSAPSAPAPEASFIALPPHVDRENSMRLRTQNARARLEGAFGDRAGGGGGGGRDRGGGGRGGAGAGGQDDNV